MTDGRLYEFRIEYTSENSVGHNYHYYLAYNAKQALNFQLEMMDHKHWDIQLLMLERKCPFSNKWINESDILLENFHAQKIIKCSE